MSRMTSAQVIGLGEYLNTDFDPSSLTVSQLLGVLGFHNVKYPSPYSKTKLVQLFNDEIKSKSSKLKKDRLKKDNSIASDDGITDGLTGMPLGGDKVAPVRRSSRRLSRAPSEEEDTTVARPDPPKRRRSSAQPNLGGPSRKAPQPTEPALVEESEPEEEDFPTRKVGRNKKNSEDAGSHSRRVSGAHEDSGWEDNNIFQSGAESSSPVRPSPARSKPPRKSAAPRKSRKASSAPPQITPPSSPTRPYDVRHFPPESKFEPQLPPSMSREAGGRMAATAKAKRTSFIPVEHEPIVAEEPEFKEEERDELNLVDGDSGVLEVDGSPADVLGDEVLNEEAAEEGEEEDQTIAVSRRIAEGGKVALRHPLSTDSSPTPLWLRLLYSLFLLATSAAVINYKLESVSIGYCDTGSNTNNVLETSRTNWAAVEACNMENRTLLHVPGGGAHDETPCPPLALIPLPHPDTCTPCPTHATCKRDIVSCDNGYLLRPHPLLRLFFLPAYPHTPSSVSFSDVHSSPAEAIWKVVSTAADGLPGLGPVAFPPRCVEDPKRKRNIGALGKAIESMLGQLRGKRVCEARERDIVRDSEGGEAKRWGAGLDDLRNAMKKKTPPHLLPTFDDTFNEAIQQLVQWGGVFISEDSEGKRFVAHHTPDLSWDCVLTVKLREIWDEWRTTVIGIAVSIAGAYLAKAQAARRRVENKQVAELVQIALDTLRNQELAHHTDPVTAPQPYLSSLQLRDLILQDEHSIPARRRLWDKVERVVEGNTNVRANLEEVHGGDELRVWRWVGNAGRGGPGLRRRIQFEERGEEDGVVA